MGLFLTADRHFQGWLAALLCCCAVSQDESPYEKERARNEASAQPRICNTQPPSLATELPATPVPTALLQTRKANEIHADPNDHRHPAPRPPSLKPFDFGESSLPSRDPHHGRKRSALHAKRPSISAPYSVRRLDTPELQRQSLVPLRLGPVVLRESPVPFTESPTTKNMMNRDRSDSTQGLLSQPQSVAYHSQRETPYERCQARSSVTAPNAVHELATQSLKRSASSDDQRSVRRSMSTKRSSSSLRRNNHSTVNPPRENAEQPLLRRKASFPMRRPFTESGDVDAEVLELNTIVEERRAEAAREKGIDEHVPAVAPSMQIHARSETLEAIGSALGRPLTAQANYRAPTPLQTRPRPSVRRSTSAGSRVSGWLSGMMMSHSVAHLPTHEPFYKCQHQAPALRRSQSQASAGTCLTDMDSPSLTAASSPTTKGHSRSHTGESRITPLSPSIVYGGNSDIAEKTIELPWPTSPTSVVGLAL